MERRVTVMNLLQESPEVHCSHEQCHLTTGPDAAKHGNTYWTWNGLAIRIAEVWPYPQHIFSVTWGKSVCASVSFPTPHQPGEALLIAWWCPPVCVYSRDFWWPYLIISKISKTAPGVPGQKPDFALKALASQKAAACYSRCQQLDGAKEGKVKEASFLPLLGPQILPHGRGKKGQQLSSLLLPIQEGNGPWWGELKERCTELIAHGVETVGSMGNSSLFQGIPRITNDRRVGHGGGWMAAPGVGTELSLHKQQYLRPSGRGGMRPRALYSSCYWLGL